MSSCSKIAALLLVLVPAVAAAGTPRTPSNSELRRAWQACTAVAAHTSTGTISSHAADWPRGFRGCAAVVRSLDVLERREARRDWEVWVTKHAAERALIRKTAALLNGKPISWAQFKRASAKAAKSAAKDTP